MDIITQAMELQKKMVDERDELLAKVKELESRVKLAEQDTLKWIHSTADAIEQRELNAKNHLLKIAEYEEKFVGTILTRIKTAIKILLGKP